MVGFYDPKSRNGASTLTIPKMSDFSTALAKQLKQSAGISKIEVIKLGNPAATSNADLLYVASNPNYIYYTTEGEEGAGIGIISKEIIPTSLRFPNKTALIFRYGSYVACLPAAGVAEEILAEATPPVIPSQTPVTTSQLDFAVLQPYIGTMYAIVKGAIYGDIGVADISTADMSDSPLDTDTNPIDIPTNANKAIGVLVQLDPATSTLSYKQSAEFPASLSLAQAYQSGLLPLRDEGKYRTGYIKLSAGVTSLHNGNVWPCPEFFPESANASVLAFAAPAELTVASGEITVSQSWHTIDTEDNDPTDELDTINGLEAGRFYFFTTSDASRITKFKHGTGNIFSTSISDVNLSTVGFWVFSPDGTNANILTHSLPNDVDTWGSYPDNSINFPVTDNSSGEMYSITGDEIQLWRTYQLSGAQSITAVPNMHLLLDSATAFLTTVTGTPLAGFAWVVQVLTAPGAGSHTVKLPSGCTWDGTNNTAAFDNTADFLEGIWISSTRFLLKPTTTGVVYSIT